MPLTLPRCIKMSLVHDLAESIVGDITPNSGVSKEEKFQREQAAIEELAGYLAVTNSEAAEELKTLWLEYEACETAGGSTDVGNGELQHERFVVWLPDAVLARFFFLNPRLASFTDAKVVKDLDKFDMVLQALEYEARVKGPGTLGEFFASVHGEWGGKAGSA